MSPKRAYFSKPERGAHSGNAAASHAATRPGFWRAPTTDLWRFAAQEGTAHAAPHAVVGAAVPAARDDCVDTSWRQHAVAATACLSAIDVLGCRKFRIRGCPGLRVSGRSEEHTSELQSLMRISYAVFCLTKK